MWNPVSPKMGMKRREMMTMMTMVMIAVTVFNCSASL